MSTSYRGRAGINPHGSDYSPVALWQLNGNLLDGGPNGFGLTVETAGTGGERYATIGNLQGFYLDGNTDLVYNALEPKLQITGDVTVELLANIVALSVCTVIGTGDPGTDTDPNNNQLYTLNWNDSSSAGTSVVWETGAGSDVKTQTVFSPSGLCHVALVKSQGGTAVQVFCNGLPVAPAVTGLTAATVGSNSKLRIGSDSSGSTSTVKATGWVASVKVVASALSAGQVKDEYNRTLGPVLGFIP